MPTHGGMPDSYPSRAVHVLRLLGNDGRAGCKCSADAPSSGRSGGAQRCVADADIGVDPSTSVAKAPHDLILAFATRDRSGLLPSAAPARSRSAEVEWPACWKRIQRAAGLSRALGHVLPSCSFGPRRECWRRRTRKIPLQTEPRAPPTQGTCTELSVAASLGTLWELRAPERRQSIIPAAS